MCPNPGRKREVCRIPRDLPGLSLGPQASTHQSLQVGSQRQGHSLDPESNHLSGKHPLLFDKGCSFIPHAATKEGLFVHQDLRCIRKSVFLGAYRPRGRKLVAEDVILGMEERCSAAATPPRPPPSSAWGEGGALSPEAKQKVWKVESERKQSLVPLSLLPKSLTAFDVLGPYFRHEFW